MDFINEPSEFFPSGCLLNQIWDDGLEIDARYSGESALAISGSRLAKYSLKIFTGQCGPSVTNIFGLNLRSGTNSWFPV